MSHMKTTHPIYGLSCHSKINVEAGWKFWQTWATFIYFTVLFICPFFLNRVDKSRMNCWEMDKSTVIHVKLMICYLILMLVICADIQHTQHILSWRKTHCPTDFFHHTIAARTACCHTHFMSPIGQHIHRLTWGWWGSSCYWCWLFQWCSSCWWWGWLTRFLLFRACWLQEEKDWKFTTIYLLRGRHTGCAAFTFNSHRRLELNFVFSVTNSSLSALCVNVKTRPYLTYDRWCPHEIKENVFYWLSKKNIKWSRYSKGFYLPFGVKHRSCPGSATSSSFLQDPAERWREPPFANYTLSHKHGRVHGALRTHYPLWKNRI